MPVILTLQRLRPEDLEFKTNLSYIEFEASLGCIAILCPQLCQTQKNREKKDKSERELSLKNLGKDRYDAVIN